MNKTERIKMIKAMEFIARQVNDEDVFDYWLVCGIADGDIDYGNLSAEEGPTEDLDYYLEDDHFGDCMLTFLRLMQKAKKSGGLYCDNICVAEVKL